MTEPTTSSGVEKLIEKLRLDGIKAGEDEGQRIVDEAEKKAQDILSKAQEAARETVARANAEIEKEREGAHEAIRLALRDAILEMKERITSRFKSQILRLVGKEFSDNDFLRQVILAVAGRSAPPAGEPFEILISAESTGGAPSKLDTFILSASREMLREGVELRPAAGDEPGIRLRLRDRDMEIDLTEHAVSSLILSHLSPRFRQIVEGVKH